MSAREELSRIIGGKLITRSSMTETADAILAAGYRKARTITAVEDLDALPVDSVVRSNGTWQKETDEDGIAPWVSPGSQRLYAAWRIALPATVLHEPGADE